MGVFEVSQRSFLSFQQADTQPKLFPPAFRAELFHKQLSLPRDFFPWMFLLPAPELCRALWAPPKLIKKHSCVFFSSSCSCCGYPIRALFNLLSSCPLLAGGVALGNPDTWHKGIDTSFIFCFCLTTTWDIFKRVAYLCSAPVIFEPRSVEEPREASRGGAGGALPARSTAAGGLPPPFSWCVAKDSDTVRAQG